jgi:hypothetical protein
MELFEVPGEFPVQPVEAQALDEVGQWSPLEGLGFVFQPDGYADCGGLAGIDVTRVVDIGPATGSQVDGVFDLSFAVSSGSCAGPPGDDGFTGQILLEGETIHTFAGAEFEYFIFPVDVTAYPFGEVVTVEILATGHDETRAVLHYEIDVVAIEQSSFSKLKSRY